MIVASPRTSDGTTGTGTDRNPPHGHDEDEPLVHEYLHSASPSRFSVDLNRIVFRGHLQGTCFLNRFIIAYGTRYGSELFAQCGCFNMNRESAWETSLGFKDRFKAVVQATIEDHPYEGSVEAYWIGKNQVRVVEWQDDGTMGG